MNHPDPPTKNLPGATPPVPSPRRRETSDPRKIERKLQADVVVWLKERRCARPAYR
jgi:hypothetical protein